MATTSESSPAGNTPPAPGYWKASDGNWYPPETHPGYRPPVVFRPPRSWKGDEAFGARGRRSPRPLTIGVLAALWAVLLLVPTVFTVVTGDDLPTRALGRVCMGSFGAALAVSGGFIFRRNGTRRQLVAAAVVGAATLGIAATIQVLTSTGYRGDYPPWGAVLIINVLVNGLLVILAVGLGQGLAAWMERRGSRRSGP